MRDAALFSFVKVIPDSMVASVRIASYLQKLLGLECYIDETIGEVRPRTLIIINGAYAFAGNTVLAGLGAAIEAADNVIWVQNDYTIIPPKHTGRAESPFRKAFRMRYERGASNPIYWTTIRSMSNEGLSPSGHLVNSLSWYINWNCLTLSEFDNPTDPSDRVLSDEMVYYGSFRKGRKPYFDRYFAEPKVEITISSPSKKFKEAYTSPLITHMGKIKEDFHGELSMFGLGLYIEDKDSHKEFMSPANRFYEMLSAGLPIAFQPESAPMLREAGYDIRDGWIAESSTNLMRFIDMQDELMDHQRDVFHDQAVREKKYLESRVIKAAEIFT